MAQEEAMNFSKLTNTFLNGKNYVSWAMAASRALSGREMLEYITGEKKRPEIADAKKLTPDETMISKQWRTTNDRIITSLLNSMEPVISDLFLMAETTHDLWEAVKAIYG
jgi:hypothetical protein